MQQSPPVACTAGREPPFGVVLVRPQVIEVKLRDPGTYGRSRFSIWQKVPAQPLPSLPCFFIVNGVGRGVAYLNRKLLTVECRSILCTMYGYLKVAEHFNKAFPPPPPCPGPDWASHQTILLPELG